MADEIRPTPRSPILGLFSDLVNLPLQYMSDPRRTQQMQGVAEFIRGTGVPSTLERLSYGQGLLTGAGGLGGTTRLRPEVAEAALTVAPMVGPAARVAGRAVMATKGLPVGASIKPLNLSEGVFKPELTMQEMLRVKDIPTVQRMQKSMDLVGEKNFKGMVEDIFKKYKPTDQDQEAMLVEAVTLDILGRANRNPDLLRGLPGLKTPAPQEEALRLAQQRAALPVSEGGLGLPAGNTPMDRARAMGFDIPAFHASESRDIQAFDNARLGQNTAYNTDSSWAQSLARKGHWFAAKDLSDDMSSYVTYPVLLQRPTRFYKSLDDAQKGRSLPAVSQVIDEEFGTTSYIVKDPSRIRSRFAAFDPTRRNEPDLLAGALPFTVLIDEENRRAMDEFLSNPIMYRDPFGSTAR